MKALLNESNNGPVEQTEAPTGPMGGGGPAWPGPLQASMPDQEATPEEQAQRDELLGRVIESLVSDKSFHLAANALKSAARDEPDAAKAKVGEQISNIAYAAIDKAVGDMRREGIEIDPAVIYSPANGVIVETVREVMELGQHIGLAEVADPENPNQLSKPMMVMAMGETYRKDVERKKASKDKEGLAQIAEMGMEGIFGMHGQQAPQAQQQPPQQKPLAAAISKEMQG